MARNRRLNQLKLGPLTTLTPESNWKLQKKKSDNESEYEFVDESEVELVGETSDGSLRGTDGIEETEDEYAADWEDDESEDDSEQGSESESQDESEDSDSEEDDPSTWTDDLPSNQPFKQAWYKFHSIGMVWANIESLPYRKGREEPKPVLIISFPHRDLEQRTHKLSHSQPRALIDTWTPNFKEIPIKYYEMGNCWGSLSAER